MTTDQTGRSWMNQETTERAYSMGGRDEVRYLIRNEYQIIDCPHCKERIFGRLTHISGWDTERNSWGQIEYHYNHGPDLKALKRLLVMSLQDEGEKVPVHEVLADGKWTLVARGQTVGIED